ncbi:MAG: hypothetical protein IPO88_23900 [Nannocystis sp.]|uniref:hypothetical protein n=1 Tax=Nannocystis sp. TaxID=1962667 RepID=UPI00242438FD|nr:hypothetical protein [Nannocystis sp.]MBK9756483.1 hypothetical protein [Nannocystis sp.]
MQGRIEPGLQVGVIGPHQTDPGMAYLDGDAGNARRQRSIGRDEYSDVAQV